jgi:hypothetical protein
VSVRLRVFQSGTGHRAGGCLPSEHPACDRSAADALRAPQSTSVGSCREADQIPPRPSGRRRRVRRDGPSFPRGGLSVRPGAICPSARPPARGAQQSAALRRTDRPPQRPLLRSPPVHRAAPRARCRALPRLSSWRARVCPSAARARRRRTHAPLCSPRPRPQLPSFSPSPAPSPRRRLRMR